MSTLKTPSHEPTSEKQTQADRFRGPFQELTDFKAHLRGLARLPANLKSSLRETWLDLLTLLLVGAITGGVWYAPHNFNRLFPITFRNGEIIYPTLAYPYTKPIFNSAAAGLVAGLIPAAVFIFAQIWIRNFHDARNAMLGVSYATVTGTCIQVIIKKTIGGLRPHFLSVCEPVIPVHLVGSGYQEIMFTIEICTGDRKKIRNAIESFPSGHANIAFAGLLYLSIYLLTHLRIQCCRRPSYWKMLLVVTPILMAVYLSSTLVLGYHHHAHDVIFGGIIGSFMAIFAYRMTFCSILDPHTNWQPLVRTEISGSSDSSEADSTIGQPSRSSLPV